MKQFSQLTISHINIFLSVARTLNMSDTAQEFFTSQSTVSKRISEIESITGLSLFLRKNNSLVLTEAGRFLYAKFNELYDKLCVDIYDATAVQNGYLDTFTIIIDTTVDVAKTFESLKILQRKYPKLNIKIETDVYNQKQKILNNECDLAMTYQEPFGTFEEQLDYRQINTVFLYAIVNKNSELAQKEKLNLEDLLNENIVIPSEQVHDGYMNNLQYYYKDITQLPQVFSIAHSYKLEYQAILNEHIVITTMESIMQNDQNSLKYLYDNLKFFPLEDAPISRAFCWKKTYNSVYIKEFLDIFFNQIQ